MIYIEKDDIPYVCVDSKESFDFMINTVKMHVGIENFDIEDLVEYGVMVFSARELDKVIEIFELNGVVVIDSNEYREVDEFISFVESQFKTKIYIPKENEI